MLRFNLRRPSPSSNSFAGFVKAVVVEPIDQRPQRGELLILDDHGVKECAHQRTATLKLRQQALVVDVEAERPCGGMSVDAVDEQRELRSVPWHCFVSDRNADANGLFAKPLYGRRLDRFFGEGTKLHIPD